VALARSGHGVSAGRRPAQDGGFLIGSWSFPTLRDRALASALNTVYEKLSPDLVRDPDESLTADDPLLAEGREQIEASGVMRVTGYWLDDEVVVAPPLRYVDWQLSYGHIAGLSLERRHRLASAIERVLSAGRPGAVEVSVRRYTVASRALRP
jgi:hypothetical protein